MYSANAGKGKSTPRELEGRLNFQNELFSQLNRRNDGKERSLVVVNSSGSWLIATRCEASRIVEHATWWLQCTNSEEASFVTALLNATCLVVAFRSTKQSDRHFESHYWYKIPLPRYDTKNETHCKLVRLAEEAEQCVEQFMAENQDLTNAKARKQIRNLLTENGINDRINLEVRKLLPAYCTE